MTDLDDGALFELWLTAKNGDAFTELARRHAPVVYDIAARALADRTAAEDVVQEALLDLALEPTRKPIEVGVVAWLVRFAICRARNWRSSERCRTRRQWIVGARRPEETMPDDHIEETEEMERALAAAEPDERTVLAMRFLHGWEYDRIAAALETSEGAARVRVHRALANVRTRLGAGDDEKKVAGRMAGLALIPLPAAKLDSAIRAVISAASAPASPVPSSQMPTALRAVLQAFCGVILLAGAATSSLHVDGAGGEFDDRPPTLLAVLPADAVPTRSSKRDTNVRSGTAWHGAPRPENWDGGALARLARGRPATATAGGVRPNSSAARESPSIDALAPAAPVADPVPHPDQPSSAFRPSERGASAANGDPGSSSDERADALGGSTRTLILESTAAVPAPDAGPVADEVPVASDPAASRRRAVTRSRPLEEFDASERALLGEAAALVRSVVEQAVAEASLADAPSLSRVKRSGVRTVQRQVRAWRNQPANAAPRIGKRKSAQLSRVYSILFDLAMSEGAIPGALRWPGGVDVADALADLIRVLSAVPHAVGSRLPGIAEGDADPHVTPERLPEFE